jgi:hypothetical protein
MAEILVLDLCARRCSPAGVSLGRHGSLAAAFFKPRSSSSNGRRAPVGVHPIHETRSKGCRAARKTVPPDFRLFSIVLRIVLFIACNCSCAGGFSQARAKPCIVIGAHFPLQIDCISPEKFSVGA